eukprot:scaffold25527_cov31-Tisochrysis_lutea.AAC.1
MAYGKGCADRWVRDAPEGKKAGLSNRDNGRIIAPAAFGALRCKGRKCGQEAWLERSSIAPCYTFSHHTCPGTEQYRRDMEDPSASRTEAIAGVSAPLGYITYESQIGMGLHSWCALMRLATTSWSKR